MYRHVMVGVSESGDASALLELARSVLAPEAVVSLVTIVAVRPDDDHADRLNAAKQRLEDLAASEKAGIGSVTTATVVSVGSAGGELARRYEESDADLLVIGLGNRSRVGKALVGSDAQTVLLLSTKPVLCQRVA